MLKIYIKLVLLVAFAFSAVLAVPELINAKSDFAVTIGFIAIVVIIPILIAGGVNIIKSAKKLHKNKTEKKS